MSPDFGSPVLFQHRLAVKRNLMTNALLMTGLKCALGQQLLGQDSAAAVDHYVSVLRTLSKDSQVCYHSPYLPVNSSILRQLILVQNIATVSTA